jgi:hypothetical protein
MMAGKRDELVRQIRQAEAELERLDALPDFGAMADGTVIYLAVTNTGSRPVPYVGLKRATGWSFTNGPSDISADQVAEWLTGRYRKVVAAVALAEIEMVSPVVDLGAALLESIQEFGSRRRGPSQAEVRAMYRHAPDDVLSDYERSTADLREDGYIFPFSPVCMLPDCGCSGSAHA